MNSCSYCGRTLYPENREAGKLNDLFYCSRECREKLENMRKTF